MLLLSCLAFPTASWAKEGQGVGKVVHAKGDVEIIGKEALRAHAGQTLFEGDTIRTGAKSKIAVALADETLVQLGPNARFSLGEVAPAAGWHAIRKAAYKGVARSRYVMEKGRGWIRNNNRNKEIEIKTKTCVVGVRGTELHIEVEEIGGAAVTVLAGRVVATNPFGSMELQAGEQVTALPGKPLSKTVLVTPEDAVQWTIVIPPFFGKRAMSREMDAILAELDAGRLNRSHELLNEYTRSTPGDPDGWGALALTKVLLGKPDDALSAVQEALRIDPFSASALIVEAYAHQALFRMDRAGESLEKALAIDGGNVIALVHLARLQFGMDESGKARRTIEKAVRLAPENAEAHNLLGYIHLAQREMDEAKSSFQEAQRLDSSLGEPHMGMALALMREGDDRQALEEIATAVLLEPRRSLFLSYWGKMLHQLGRYDKSLEVLATAARMDPRDPTPEFYQSLILKDLNRPVEAIRSINRAVDLNDHRAVYRSRFLLDRDLAVKNVDLSILYNQLGLSGWARNKAAASVKEDYLNPSGHLFLGGAFSTEEDRAWAASGEYLLARLLQPANANTFNTFNEYTTFFDKPALNGMLGGAVGSDGAAEGDFAAYGAHPGCNLAFGGQASWAQTDGWRDVNKERRGNLAMMAKWDASEKDGLMAVASFQKSALRDAPSRRFEYDSPSDPEDALDDRLERLELGYHRRQSSMSDILLYASHMDYRGELFDPKFWKTVDLTAKFIQPHDQFQGQYLLRTARHRMIVGTMQYHGDDTLVTDYSVFNIHADNAKRRHLASYYIADAWKAAPDVIIEGALYYDDMTNSDAAYDTQWKIRQWSPRLGVVFTPSTRDTIRLAGFRYLLPFITSRIDPMDIAGVPVFRNAFAGTLIDEADATWEREFSAGYLSSNLFYLERKREHNVITGASEAVAVNRGRQKGVAFLFERMIKEGLGMIEGGLGVAARYRWQHVNEEGDLSADRKEHLASLALRYVHPGGFSSSVAETFRHDRYDAAARPDERIWITDVRIGYEFPKKRGALSLEINNIFNRHFNWVTDDFVLTGRIPSRETRLTLSVNF